VTDVRVIEVDDVVGESRLEAFHAASSWLATQC
jgi:hypothetical protein